MTESDRPALLREAAAAVAYERWLIANGLEDSNASAWRFAAESSAPTSASTISPTLTDSAASERLGKPRWWIPVTIALAAIVAVAAVFVYAIVTAEQWTKIDQEEVARTIQVPDGTWNVTHDDKDICFVGQNYWDCIDDYTSEWNFACAERVHDTPSRQLCEQYYDLIQEMKTNAAGDEYSEVSGLVQSGRLSLRENTKSERVVDVPEQSHEAVCYLGFIGECPSENREVDDSGA